MKKCALWASFALGCAATTPPGATPTETTRTSARAEAPSTGPEDAPIEQAPIPSAPPDDDAPGLGDALASGADTPDGEVSPPTPVTVEVPGDNAIEVVAGAPDHARAIVYLHGVCGDPFAFQSWAAAAAAHATFISLRGDEPCDDRPGRFKWSFDYAKLDRRIQGALAAADTFRRTLAAEVTPLDRDDVVLIGYSQGAHRVQWMAARYPERYRRVALIAMATEPSPARLARAEKVLVMAGAWDARTHLWEGHNALKKAGKAVLYREFPKARHGEYGPAAEETMAEALEWLFK